MPSVPTLLPILRRFSHFAKSFAGWVSPTELGEPLFVLAVRNLEQAGASVWTLSFKR